jgi:hypothetical protein
MKEFQSQLPELDVEHDKYQSEYDRLLRDKDHETRTIEKANKEGQALSRQGVDFHDGSLETPVKIKPITIAVRNAFLAVIVWAKQMKTISWIFHFPFRLIFSLTMATHSTNSWARITTDINPIESGTAAWIHVSCGSTQNVIINVMSIMIAIADHFAYYNRLIQYKMIINNTIRFSA